MHPTRQTWRVRDVPLDFDKKRLADALHLHPALKCTNGAATNDADGANCDNGVCVHTLAPDVKLTVQVATVRFCNLPTQLRALERDDQLVIDIHVPSPSLRSGHNGNRDSIQPVKIAIDQRFNGITVLSAPSIAEHRIDVLAISGLGSHPFGSFVHKKDGHMWLSDSLPGDIPNARVMIYGYDSGLQGSTSFAQLEDLAGSLQMAICRLLRPKKKPLVVIGHSLGGLLIKEALIRIVDSDSESGLIDLVCGFVLFGVPNSGMDIESLVPMVNDQPNRSLLESLSEMNSQILRLQNRNFSRVLKQTTFRMFCFYETRLSRTAAKNPATGQYKMSGPPRCLVSVASATSCLPSEASSDHSVAIDRTHSDLIKFTYRDPEYDKVADVLEQIQRSIENLRVTNSRDDKIHERDEASMPDQEMRRGIWAGVAQQNRPSDTTQASQKPHFIVPFGRNKDFVGRGEILEQLLKVIPPNLDKDDCQRTAIAGLGGVGKTQIALEVAFQIQDQHPDCSVFWVPVVDATSFENAFREIGRQLEVEGIDQDKADIKLLVKTALSKENAGSWLLVIDNADDIELLFGSAGSMPISECLPFSRKGSILFTTRNRKTVVKLDIPKSNVIATEEMSREEAIELLQRHLEESQIGDAASTNGLLDLLADLPLAIKQASAYMAQEQMSILEYLECCNSSDKDMINLLSRDFEDRHRYKMIRNPVATTWLVSFHRISRHDPLATDYLKFMCFLAEKDAPRSLLPSAEPLKAAEAIGTLKAYAFITQRKESNSFDTHRLVRLAMRNWLEEQGERNKYTTSVIERLAEEFPFPRYENKDLWMKYLPHAQAALDFREGAGNKKAEGDLLSRVGDALFQLGRYTEAEQMNRQTLEMREKVLGKEHPDTLSSMNNLATALYSQGQDKEAEQLYRQTLEMREKVLGKEHPNTRKARIKHAECLRTMEEAKKLQP